MSEIMKLALLCIFGPVAALIAVTVFFYLLNLVDDWISDRRWRAAVKRLNKRNP